MLDHEKLRTAALAILQADIRCTRKAGSFLGQCAVDPSPLTEKQFEWFGQLAERAGVEFEGANDNG